MLLPMAILLVPAVNQGNKRLLHGRVRLAVVRRLGFQCVRGPAGDKLAVIDQPDAVAVFRLIHKVGGDHYRHAFINHAIDM
ncbi:Uncharacterised protein [Klebsiella pneumoniae]|nr:Uncharacterised protein [Klebsiella pneumoniae]